MNHGGGHVCVLTTDKVREVPTTLKESPSLLQLLGSIWRMKVRILCFILGTVEDCSCT
jgi:hypothetical protein